MPVRTASVLIGGKVTIVSVPGVVVLTDLVSVASVVVYAASVRSDYLLL